MADVQKENGYTPVANEIIEQLVRLPINGTQWRIIAVILRFTYGFSRKEHEISESFLVKATGISKRFISSELKKLIDLRIVKVIKESTFITPKVLAFNKDFDTWGSSRALQQMNDTSTVEEKVISTVERSFTSTGEGSFYQENKYKTNNKANIYDDFYNTIWLKYPRKEGKGTVSAAQKKKLYTIGIDEMTRTIERYRAKIEAEHTEPKYIKQGGTFFNSGYVDYLDENYTDSAVRKKQDFSDPGRYEGQTW